MNVHIFHVDGSCKRFQRSVIKSVQGGHQAQIFCDALRQGLGERMILHRQRNVVAKQAHGAELRGFVRRIARAATESDNACQFARRP